MKITRISSDYVLYEAGIFEFGIYFKKIDFLAPVRSWLWDIKKSIESFIKGKEYCCLSGHVYHVRSFTPWYRAKYKHSHLPILAICPVCGQLPNLDYWYRKVSKHDAKNNSCGSGIRLMHDPVKYFDGGRKYLDSSSKIKEYEKRTGNIYGSDKELTQEANKNKQDIQNRNVEDMRQRVDVAIEKKFAKF